MYSHKGNNTLSAVYKARSRSRRASMLPAALQPDAILEAASYDDATATATLQSATQPVPFANPVAHSKKIDSSSSSANSEATLTVTSANRNTLRSARRSLRVPTTASASAAAATPTPTNTPTAVTPMSAKTGQKQRELTDELNKHNSNLFVRNLSGDVDQADLDAVFGAYGTILSSAVMRNIHTGESLGTGFVRFSTHEEAQQAMEELQNRTIKSRAICIHWAKRHDGAPVGDARKKIMKLFVRNIPLDCTVEMLEELFGKYGSVRQVTVHKDTAPVEDPAMERLIAFVIFTEEGAAERAATAVHNTKPFPSCNGIPVMIKLAEDQVRHDRPRNQRYSQPTSPQQHEQQQQQRFLAEHPDDQMDPTAFLEPIPPVPQSPSNSSEYSNSRGGVLSTCAGPVTILSPFDYKPCNATYIPPSALVPNTTPVMLLNGRPCISPTRPVSVGDYMHTTCSAPFVCTSQQPVLCSPLTSSLSVNVSVSVGPASALNSSFAGSTAGESHRTVLRVATPTCPRTNNNSTVGSTSNRSSPENSVESNIGRAGVVIPNPRSAIRAAVTGNRPRCRQNARNHGYTLQIPRPPLSPCLSFETPSLPLSPAMAQEGCEGNLQSPLKYRHNPYSLLSSVFVC